MATRIQQYTTATNPQWLKRVEMALMQHALWQAANPDESGELAALARRVLESPVGHAATLSKAVCVQDGVQAGIEASFANGGDETGGNVTDQALESAVQAVFPAFVR